VNTRCRRESANLSEIHVCRNMPEIEPERSANRRAAIVSADGHGAAGSSARNAHFGLWWRCASVDALRKSRVRMHGIRVTHRALDDGSARALPREEQRKKTTMTLPEGDDVWRLGQTSTVCHSSLMEGARRGR